ncbi:Peptidoglycan/LPS O-acetylase OafA/YrhL, contains acyltransferase and SGNH-hydrolase domains [Nonlabens sp. Hel1_33_55]|uniref:acyltransferase family protein n=1 Tax=Nonlabens sp. Hel1_33_55 TaxID=1336802 RepID=UPI000875BEFA|nr:acyltransferase [Nonlabens sp. Hel1_33_55]SCX92633.1 Peptidoglycan/LPS O-acetylase OafA/YrhL, contains acyltransferase and SGNH-hydrolase domains [Nonlabens sp. Hel1_33_55]
MKKRFEFIDSLRGIGILMVMVYHTYQDVSKIYVPELSLFFSQGARGVQLFFIVSAFTLYYSQQQRERKGSNTIGSFFFRRYFRIAPMYYLGIFIFSMMIIFNIHHEPLRHNQITIFNIVSNFVFLNSLNPEWINAIVLGGWSISVEFLFYFMFPLNYKYVSCLKGSINFLMITLIMSAVSSFVMKRLFHFEQVLLLDEFLFYNIFNQLPVFAIGIVGFQIIREKKFFSNDFSYLLLLMTIIVLFVFWDDFTMHHLLNSVVFATLMVALSMGKFDFLNIGFLSYFGKISYSCYLVHFAVLFVIVKFNFIQIFEPTTLVWNLCNYFVMLLIILGTTALISQITYNLIERPFIKLGRSVPSLLIK